MDDRQATPGTVIVHVESPRRPALRRADRMCRQQHVHEPEMLADQPLPLAQHWRQRDLQVLWHPCTQMREHPHTLPLVPIARGERRMVDRPRRQSLPGRRQQLVDQPVRPCRTAHRWCHCRPGQATGTGAGFGHEPAISLAERLLALAPRQPGREPLAKVFYADNGSAGVEVALKMAFSISRTEGTAAHAFHRIGERRTARPRRAGAGRHSAVSPRLCAAAGRSAVRALARCFPG